MSQTIFVPVGYALTMTAPADSAGGYFLVGEPGDDPGAVTALSAGTPATVGPFNVNKKYNVFANNGEVTIALAQSGVVTAVDDAALALKAPLVSPTLVTPTLGVAAATKVTITKANGAEASNLVTASGAAGVITTSSLSTAAGAAYDITWTNTSIAATSVVLLTLLGGTNTKFIQFKVVPGSGTATLSIQNLDLLAALNGTILIGYLVV